MKGCFGLVCQRDGCGAVTDAEDHGRHLLNVSFREKHCIFTVLSGREALLAWCSMDHPYPAFGAIVRAAMPRQQWFSIDLAMIGDRAGRLVWLWILTEGPLY